MMLKVCYLTKRAIFFHTTLQQLLIYIGIYIGEAIILVIWLHQKLFYLLYLLTSQNTQYQ